MSSQCNQKQEWEEGASLYREHLRLMNQVGQIALLETLLFLIVLT